MSEERRQMTHQLPDFTGYFRVISRQKKTILLLTAIAAVVAVICSILLPNIYTARAKILPSQQQTSIMSSMMMQGPLANLAGDLVTDKSPAKLYAEILKVESLRDPIIDRFKLNDVYDKKYRQDVHALLNKKVSILTGKEGIITIAVDDKDPRRAADLANAFVEELQKMTVTLNATGAGNNRAFLEERLSRAKVDLEKSADSLKKFQEKNKAISFPEQAAGAIKGIAELEAQLTEKEVQLAILRRTLTDSNQKVKNMRTAIANLKSQIAKYESGKGGGAVPMLGSAPELAKEYIQVMREFKTNEMIAELLTKQYEMARLSEANDVSPIQVIQKATIPEKKSKPARARIVLTTAFVALFFSIIGILSREYIKKPIRADES